MFPGLDLYDTDPAQHLRTAGKDLDDLSDLCDVCKGVLGRENSLGYPDTKPGWFGDILGNSGMYPGIPRVCSAYPT